jgi:hypothetical protein
MDFGIRVLRLESMRNAQSWENMSAGSATADDKTLRHGL